MYQRNTKEVAFFVYLGSFDGPKLPQLRHYFLAQLSQIHLLSFAEFSSGNYLGMSRQGFCLYLQPGNCIIHLMEIYVCNLYNIHFKGVHV